MPKLIDYPRTSYTGAWELAEIVDDTGGKCAIDTAARKLNRKVSGSFKAIIGSAVKFGLMTSKRDLLTTTTLFKRIKHAYDKAEELQFHREAFLTPPLFTQLCRKFRNRELPVQMLDVMLIREFGVEEINAQSVAKAFVDGCRMCGLMDERNTIADIDALSAGRTPQRELASQTPPVQPFSPISTTATQTSTQPTAETGKTDSSDKNGFGFSGAVKDSEPTYSGLFARETEPNPSTEKTSFQSRGKDAIANLFGLDEEPITDGYPSDSSHPVTTQSEEPARGDTKPGPSPTQFHSSPADTKRITNEKPLTRTALPNTIYQMQMSGPGVNTTLEITEEDDIAIAMALLEKIRRQLRLNA